MLKPVESSQSIEDVLGPARKHQRTFDGRRFLDLEAIVGGDDDDDEDLKEGERFIDPGENVL